MSNIAHTLGRMRGGRGDNRSRNVAMLLHSLGGLANLSAVGMKAYQDYIKEDRLDKERADVTHKKELQDKALIWAMNKGPDYWKERNKSQAFSDFIQEGNEMINPGDASTTMQSIGFGAQQSKQKEQDKIAERKDKLAQKAEALQAREIELKTGQLPPNTREGALKDLQSLNTELTFLRALPEGEREAEMVKLKATAQAKLQNYLQVIGPDLKAAKGAKDVFALLRPAWAGIPEELKKDQHVASIYQYIDSNVKEDTTKIPEAKSKEMAMWMAERPHERIGMVEYVDKNGDLDLGSVSKAKRNAFVGYLPLVTNLFKANGVGEVEAARRTTLGAAATMKPGSSYAFDVPPEARPTKRSYSNPAPGILNTHISPTDEMKQFSQLHAQMQRTAKNSEEANMKSMFGSAYGEGLNQNLSAPDVSNIVPPIGNAGAGLGGVMQLPQKSGQLNVGGRSVPIMQAIQAMREDLQGKSEMQKKEMRDALLRALK